MSERSSDNQEVTIQVTSASVLDNEFLFFFSILTIFIFIIIIPNLFLLNVDDVALYGLDNWQEISRTWAIRDGRLSNLPVIASMLVLGIKPAAASVYFIAFLALSISSFSFVALDYIIGRSEPRLALWFGALAATFPLMAESYSFVTAGAQFGLGFVGATLFLLADKIRGRFWRVIVASLGGTLVTTSYQPLLLLIFVTATLRLFLPFCVQKSDSRTNLIIYVESLISLLLSVLGFFVINRLFSWMYLYMIGEAPPHREIYPSGLITHLFDYAQASGNLLTAGGAFRGILSPLTMAAFAAAAILLESLRPRPRGASKWVTPLLGFGLLFVAANPMNMVQQVLWPTPRTLVAFSFTSAAIVVFSTQLVGRAWFREGLRAAALLVLMTNLLSVYFARGIQTMRDVQMAGRVLALLEQQNAFTPSSSVYVNVDAASLQQMTALSYDIGASIFHYPAQKVALLNYVGGHHLTFLPKAGDACVSRDSKALRIINVQGGFVVCQG